MSDYYTDTHGWLHRNCHHGVGCHPIVVIDPEDAEQVQRLWDIYIEQNDVHPTMGGLPAALREFAAPTPPKPDEPQGLGAVVEDAEGALFVRTVLPVEDADVLNKPWSNGPVRRHWQVVDAVRVLSHGYTEAAS